MTTANWALGGTVLGAVGGGDTTWKRAWIVGTIDIPTTILALTRTQPPKTDPGLS
jgi:hypothetical protein